MARTVQFAGEAKAELAAFNPGEVVHEDDEARYVYVNDAEIRAEPKVGSRESKRQAIVTTLVEEIDALEQAADTPTTWAALTAQQRDGATRRAVLLVAKLARLALGRF